MFVNLFVIFRHGEAAEEFSIALYKDVMTWLAGSVGSALDCQPREPGFKRHMLLCETLAKFLYSTPLQFTQQHN